MARRRRVRVTKELVWDVTEWQRAWGIAMERIDGAPTIVAERIAFRNALDMLDRGFAAGDAFQFQLGILTMMDCCNEAIEHGDCYRWW
jgi:hypothetical protein